MEGLRLREERKYTPEEVGLATPLIFGEGEVVLVHQGFEIPVKEITSQRDRCIIEQQVSFMHFDRAILPVWMVYGKLDSGFFSGVLRPHRYRTIISSIALSKTPEFHFYLEQQGLSEIGTEVSGREILEQGQIKGLTMRAPKDHRRMLITPNFRIHRFDQGQHNIVVFRPANTPYRG